MPRSDWGKLSKAIAGLAALAAVIVAYLLWSEADSEDLQHQITAEQNADYYANAASVEAQLECAVTHVSDEECSRQAQQAARPDQRNEYDLAAQRTMAAWTRAMGKAGVIGVAVGILGLGLIFVTFRETRRAADEARNNVTAFKEAERARINIIKQDYARWEENPQFLIDIKVNNFGRSPARVREVHWLGTDSIDWNDIGLKMSASRSLTKVIKPDDAWEFLHTINVPKEARYVAGWVKYETQFSKHSKTYFLWRIGEAGHSDESVTLYALQEQGGKNWPEDT